jgi:hypothetical protein
MSKIKYRAEIRNEGMNKLIFVGLYSLRKNGCKYAARVAF